MPTPVTPTRRTVLVTGAAVLVAAGCSAKNPLAEPKVSDLSHDEQAAIKADRAVAGVVAAITATLAARPGLKSLLDPVLAMHAAHAKLLGQVKDPGPTATPSPFVVPPDRPGALAALLTLEGDLAKQLAALAAKAESGEWARVLASMSAAILQRGPVFAPPAAGGSAP